MHWLWRMRGCMSKWIGVALYRGEDLAPREPAAGSGRAIEARAGDGGADGRRGLRAMHAVRRVSGGMPEGNQHRRDRADESRLPRRDAEEAPRTRYRRRRLRTLA